MGIRFYDEAILTKLENWVKDPNMTLLGPGGLMLSPNNISRTFQILANNGNDKEIRLPLIILSRADNITVTNVSKQPLTYNGAVEVYSEDGTKTSQLNAVPITLNYQIDIVTKYYAEADEYVRNFIFNIINYPKLSITIPYNNLNYKHNSNMILEPEINDVSDNPQLIFPGQFSDWSIRFTVDDAYLFSVPVSKTWSIDDPVYIKIKDGDTYITETVNLSI